MTALPEPLHAYFDAMPSSDQMSSNPDVVFALKKVKLGISVMIAASLLVGFGVLYVQKLGDKHDYARYTAPNEADLVHTQGRITRISNHIPYLEIQLDDGRDLLATFLVFPQRGGHDIYVRNTGAFNQAKLSALASCGRAEFEFYPMHGSMISYWIYGLKCDGTDVLSYRDTMSYLALRKP
ncbi:hypothetical protein [Burkholderia gladioli]|uniref:hypothetical protein n=1 Tax=Burkholderia gladioli TaxID=28095 RepID=UPI00163E9752|nr:hypothetical protein [Burkholderia gladioli]